MASSTDVRVRVKPDTEHMVKVLRTIAYHFGALADDLDDLDDLDEINDGKTQPVNLA